tara:strand:- start:5552 stop:6493 length:942 start_codon:yes stop_codon:yes gene_type:complete
LSFIINRFHKGTIALGILFLSISCSTFQPNNSWNLRDTQSLDANIMNTKQWLRKEKSNFKYLRNVLAKELKYYRSRNTNIFQIIQSEMIKIEDVFKLINKSLSKQIKYASIIKKKRGLNIFDDNSGLIKSGNNFFSFKKNKVDMSNKSEKEVKIIEGLITNSSIIIENQKIYNSSINNLTSIFKKQGYNLIIIPYQVEEYNTVIKQLISDRKELKPQSEKFDILLSEALFKSAKSNYLDRVIQTSEKIIDYNKKMDRFESFVFGLEKTAGKECKGLVYLIKDGKEKKYQEKYRVGLEEYRLILREVPLLMNSI